MSIIYKWTDASKTRIYQNDDPVYETTMKVEEESLSILTQELAEVQAQHDKQSAKVKEMKRQLNISAIP